MEQIKNLIKFSKDLEEEKPTESAYWHLQQLRKEMKKALNIQNISNSCETCEALGSLCAEHEV